LTLKDNAFNTWRPWI